MPVKQGRFTASRPTDHLTPSPEGSLRGFLGRVLRTLVPMQRATHDNQRVAILLVLTLATGVVDAVSYVSLDHVFTANMSGNMAILGIGAITDFGLVLGNLFAIAGFVVGSVMAARLLRALSGLPLQKATIVLQLQLGFLVGITLLFVAVDVPNTAIWRYTACALLALAMGIQTGVARHLKVQDVNTTVATMTLHDLAAASRIAGGGSERWKRRVTVVLALLVGAALGTWLDLVVRWGGMALTTAVVGLALLMTQLADEEPS